MLDLADFEAFTETSFSPVPLGATLLRATNVADDSELDLATAAKRLRFDVAECDKRTRRLAAAHAPTVASALAQSEHVRQVLDDNIVPAVRATARQYARIDAEVVAPYDAAVALHAALTRVHDALTLLRNAGFFLVFMQQLHECDALLARDADSRERVRQARLLVRLTKLAEGDARRVRIVRDYSAQVAARRAQVAAELSSAVASAMAHHTSFRADNSELLASLYALWVLDRDAVYSAVERGVTQLVAVAAAGLARALQLPRAFRTVVVDARAAADAYVGTLRAVLVAAQSDTEVDPDTELTEDKIEEESNYTGTRDGTASPEGVKGGLLSAVESHYGSIRFKYWEEMSLRFKKSLAATMARGGPVARNVRAAHAAMTAAATDALGPSPGGPELLLVDALSVIEPAV